MTYYIQTEVTYSKTIILMRDFHHHYGGKIDINKMLVTINNNQFKFVPVNYPKSRLKRKTVIKYEDFYNKYYKSAK